jgi:outer membrane protein TolC
VVARLLLGFTLSAALGVPDPAQAQEQTLPPAPAQAQSQKKTQNRVHNQSHDQILSQPLSQGQAHHQPQTKSFAQEENQNQPQNQEQRLDQEQIQLPPQTQITASASASVPAPDPRENPGGRALRAFTRELVAGNRTIQGLRHDGEIARQQRGKSKTTFEPVLSISESSAKSANRVYDTTTGIDTDYTTRRRGTDLSLRQKTFLGTGRLDLTDAKTDYTSAQTSYFSAAYLALETELLRRPWTTHALDRKMIRGRYAVETERIRSVLHDTLMNALKLLIDRLIARENQQFKSRNVGFYQKMVEEATVKLENGLGSELDLKQAQMRRTVAETDLEESRLALDERDRLIGLTLGTPDWNRDLASFSSAAIASLVPEQLDLSEVLQKGASQRPDLTLLRLQRDQQQTAVRLTREQAKPNVAATVRWGRQGRATDQGMARDMRDKSWDVSVAYTTPLGPQAERFDARIEQERLQSLRVHLTQGEEAARKAITEVFHRLRFHRRNLVSLRQSQDLAAAVLEGQRLNFQLGKTSLIDLMKYQSDFEASCLAVIRGEAQLAENWLTLLYEIGELPEHLDIDSRQFLADARSHQVSPDSPAFDAAESIESAESVDAKEAPASPHAAAMVSHPKGSESQETGESPALPQAVAPAIPTEIIESPETGNFPAPPSPHEPAESLASATVSPPMDVAEPAESRNLGE